MFCGIKVSPSPLTSSVLSKSEDIAEDRGLKSGLSPLSSSLSIEREDETGDGKFRGKKSDAEPVMLMCYNHDRDKIVIKL